MYVYIPKKLYYVTYMWNLKNQTHKNRDQIVARGWRWEKSISHLVGSNTLATPRL